MPDHSVNARMKLQDVCHLITDGKHGDCENQGDSGYYFLSCKDVRDGKLNYVGARQITEADFLDTHRRTQLEPDDILITNSGTIGRMAIAPKANRTHQTTFQKSVAIVKPDHAKVLSRWLYYYLLAEVERLIAFAGGTAQKNLLLRDMRAFEIEVPPLPVQLRIASILSTYDDLIENNTRRIAILEEMARRLYEEWFVHFRFPGHEDVPFTETEHGRVPEGWETQGLYDIAEVTYGHPFKSKLFNEEGVGIGAIRIRDIQASEIKTYTLEEGKPKHKVANGDILVGMDGQFHMGKWTGGEAWLVQRVARFRPISSMGRYLLFLSVERPIKHLEETIVGTTVAHLSAKDLKAMTVTIPSDDVLTAANSFLEPLYDIEMALRRKNANLRAQRDLLLPKLVSGEIDVSEAEETREEAVA